MHATLPIIRRELAAYFNSPLAYVFIVIFLVLAGSLTFYVGGWLERGQADLRVFFQWHPWLYLFLVPAVGMRLWAEERKSGTIEFLMTQPISTAQAVIGKFVAAWLFVGIALVLTFPLWLTVNYLGPPDNGVILAGYIGSWLMAGSMLAISEANRIRSRTSSTPCAMASKLVSRLSRATASTRKSGAQVWKNACTISRPLIRNKKQVAAAATNAITWFLVSADTAALIASMLPAISQLPM